MLFFSTRMKRRVFFMLNCTFCFVCGSLKRIKWLGEKNSLWNGMWCSTEVFQSQRLCCRTLLTPGYPPPLPFCQSLPYFFPALHSLLRVHLITSIFLWLSFLWIKSCWEFAALNYSIVINEAWAPTLLCSTCWSVPERLVPYQGRWISHIRLIKRRGFACIRWCPGGALLAHSKKVPG